MTPTLLLAGHRWVGAVAASKVKPGGWWGVVVLGLIIALFFLMRSFRHQLNRIHFDEPGSTATPPPGADDDGATDTEPTHSERVDPTTSAHDDR